MVKYNYKLAKVDDGRNLVYAPIPIIINDVPYWVNEQAEEYKEYEKQGWYPIEHTKKPEKEGCYYTSYWAIEENKCIQKWEEHEIPKEEVVE